MLKSPLSFCMTLALASTAFAVTTVSPIMPSRDSDGCYQISTSAELYGFAAIVNGTDGMAKDTLACGVLTKDVVVNSGVLTDAGELNVEDTANFAVWTPPMNFTGKFDGRGHTVSGLYVNDSLKNCVGLIGVTTAPYQYEYGRTIPYPEVVIKDVHVKGSYFRGQNYVGGLLGQAYSSVSTIVSGSSFDGVVMGSRHVGGIIGGSSSNGEFTIKNSFNKGSVFAGSAGGGIIGSTYYMDRYFILNAINLGTVTSDSSSGGIMGENWSDNGVFVNVVNVGEVRLDKLEASIEVKSIIGEKGYTINRMDNVFYLTPGSNEHYGVAVTENQLADGSIASLMHDYNYMGIDGSVWGQDVGTDKYPVLTGTVEGASFESITVTLDTHGGEAVEIIVPAGFQIRIPDVERDGFMNLGWYDNADFAGKPVEFSATSNTNLTYWGKFVPISTITLNVNGGTVDSGLVESYTEGIGAMLPRKVSRTGHIFVGWYAEEDFNGNKVLAVDSNATGAQVFYARWYKMETPEKDGEGCYVIKTAPELYGFAAIVNGTAGYTKEKNACAGLANDIVVNEGVLKADGTLDSANAWKFVPWNPIDSFAGVFDGNMHVVSGLFFDDTTFFRYDFGFFGSVAGTSEKYAELKNFGLVGSYFAAATSYYGAVVGATVRAELGNSYAPPASYVKISGVYNMSTIYSYVRPQGVAGIVGSVGYKGRLELENVYNRGRVIGKSVSAAGLVGHNMSDAKIKATNCYSVWKTKDGMDRSSKALFRGYDAYSYTVSNCYYLNTQGVSEGTGLPASDELFKNGSVALALSEGVNGSIWGQNVGEDEFPNFSGEIENSLAQKYVVKFNTFDGDDATYFDSYIAGFKKALPTSVVKPNANFMGWYDNGAFEGNVVTYIDSTATGDKEYWAKLQRTFSVTYEMNGGWIDSGAVYTYIEGIGAKLPRAVSLDSNVFAGWYDNEELTGKPVAVITPEDSENKTYYASWFKLKMPVLDSTDKCYEISDAAELYGFAALVNGTHRMYYNWSQTDLCGKLTQDIVVNENVLKEDGTLDSANAVSFLPWEMMKQFGGKFDGQGHKISGLYGVAAGKTQAMAMFGDIIEGVYDWEKEDYSPVIIRNLTLEDSYFGTERAYAAGFVTVIKGARTQNRVKYPGATVILDSCHFKGMVYSDSSSAAGLVASSNGTLSITNSSVDGLVRGYAYTGGISASLMGTTSITNSINMANIVGGYSSTGGLVGYNSGTATFMNNANHGDVTNELHNNNAGLCGGVLGETYGKLVFVQNYNDGNLSGPSSYIGGLISSVSGSEDILIANNYNTGDVHSTSTKNTYVAGLIARFTYDSAVKTLVNNYSIGGISRTNEKYGAVDYVIAEGGNSKTVFVANNYATKTVDTLDASAYGTVVPEEEIEDGTVAALLHDYVQKDTLGNEVEGGVTGAVWIQGEDHPILVTKEEFSVVLNTNGGTLENAPTAYKFGEGLVLPEPTRVGFDFAGWFVSKTFMGSAVTEITAKDAGDKIFYAKWEAKEYTVTVKVNNPKWGVVKGLKNEGVYKYGDEVELTAVADNGYEFSFWQDNDRLNNKNLRFTVVADTTVTANFKAIVPESSSSVESSSSAEPPASSSSVPESSSSEVKSSSSEVPSSSSEEPSSSSSEPETSSSSSDPATSSSESEDAIPAIAVAPSFRVTVMGRMLQVAGARAGAEYALFDMQGHMLRSGSVNVANFSIPVSRAGSYLVRIGREIQRVSVR